MNELSQVIRDLNALKVASESNQVTNGEKLSILRIAKDKLDRVTYQVIRAEMKELKEWRNENSSARTRPERTL